jgi:ketosteroid isomerase-like protein
MSEHQNAARARRAFEDFNNREFDSFVDLIAEDTVAYVADPRQAGATVRIEGKPNLFAVLQKYDEVAGGTMHVDVTSVLADDTHVMLFCRGRAERRDRSHDFRQVMAAKVDGEGRWKEVWYLSNDHRDHEQFWAQ